jgi:cytoskeletal protein CcmA (bactofilin family)
MYRVRRESVMFSLFRRRGTIIAEGLKIVGSVTAEGLVEVNGHIEGDLHCTSLVVSPKAAISGGIEAEKVVVNGRVEGPIRGGEVLLKSHAHVVGDIQHSSLAVEKGAFFDGRSVRSPESNVQRHKPEKPEKLTSRLRRERELSVNGHEPAAASAA